MRGMETRVNHARRRGRIILIDSGPEDTTHRFGDGRHAFALCNVTIQWR